MSLGLMRCMELEEMRFAELGRREAESVAGGGEELPDAISTTAEIRARGNVLAYRTLVGDRTDSGSVDADIFE